MITERVVAAGILAGCREPLSEIRQNYKNDLILVPEARIELGTVEPADPGEVP